MDQYTQNFPLPQLVRRFIDDLPGVNRVVIAVSGGLDSMVLLHASVAAELAVPLVAVHVNHQLSIHAELWRQHVEQVCRRLNLPCIYERVSVAAGGGGLEQAARTARYEAIGRHLQAGDLVLMAHHQQDQVETFFLRLARGAGTTGLGAMAAVRQWGPAKLGRPFLNQRREQLFAYATQHGLTWVEDESNTSDILDRNYLRLQVLPLVQQRWPAFPTQVVKAAQLLRASDQLLGEYASEDLQRCQPRDERVGQSVLADIVRGWSAPRRNQVLRHWLTLQNYAVPSQKQLAEIANLLDAAEDQNPLLNWGECELRRFRRRIYCLPKNWACMDFGPTLCNLQAQDTVTLAAGVQLRPFPQQPGFAPGEYTVLPRRCLPNLKRAHPAARQHSQSIKKLLQEYELEPWLRDRVPLVLAGEQLVAVADLWVEKAFLSNETDAIFLRWLPSRPAVEPALTG